ncbi:NAD-dependent epimerase/dehydratase family protein [Algoriphagus formosus]|uniref:NAD-dependent epimerase/dehydratase family protein n=1 Tax=Algoriphagus formosus TaxID=2007308 RepID=UPI000C28C51C|nr:NAD-dependent epimerase/dehydratase family protein [Algoriphagus formosus]
MKIFVTGATGFIGSNFLKKSIFEGHEVIGLKRSPDSNIRIKLEKEPIWLVKSLDKVTREDLLGADVVVHLAAHSMSPPYDTLENCMYWNVLAPLKLFNQAIEAGVKRFVVAGSCFEYGKSGEDYEFIPVNAPLKPTLTYAASKAAASIAFYQLAIEKKLELSIHRIFHVYGPGEADYRLWPSLKRAAENGEDFPMTLGEQVRDFIHVDEVVNQLLDYCFEGKIESGKPLVRNLGTGKAQSILEFSESWWNKWGAKGKLLVGQLPYRNGEVMRYAPEV